MQAQSKHTEPSKIDNQIIHKGIYFSNERRKGKGGRIRSESINLKIQTYDKYAALHQSEVEWVQVRRYTKNNQNQRKAQKVKQIPKKQKVLKYIPKQQLKKVPKKKYKQKDTNINSQSELTNYAQTENIKKQKNIDFHSKEQQLFEQITEKITNEQKQQRNEQKQQRNEQKQQRNEQKQQRNQLQKNEESGEQSEQEKQIIVAEILRETKILYKQQPFVGLFSFVQINKNKYQNKTEKQKSIFQIFANQNEFEVYPINKRLQIMVVDDPLKYEQLIIDYIGSKQLQSCSTQKSKLKLIFTTLENVYVLFKFSRWKGNCPLAQIIKIVGKINTVNGECSCMLHEYGLNDFDHQDTHQQLKQLPLNPSKEHKVLNRMVFTIDPATSTDLDDALSIQQLQQSVYEIGIHIADVTSYLHTINRDQLLKRTTSVYLPHKVYHMLPPNLVKICSLDPNLERLSFSIFVKMTKNGDVIGESRLEKNIVKSRFKLSYDTYQQFLIGNMKYANFKVTHDCTEEQFQILNQKLLNLGSIALAHRNKRIIFDVFQNREIQFELNENGWPTQVSIETRYSAKKVIEQYMILGNVEAARHLVLKSPSNALIIHHPNPSQQSVLFFNETFKEIGIKFTFDDNKQTQRQLLKVKEMTNLAEQLKELCFFKARRVQQSAEYKTYQSIIEAGYLKKTKVIHFALGAEFYTHFTSPMRRMADIIVHQRLNSVLFSEPMQPIIDSEIERINFGRIATKRLKRDLNEVYLCLMLMGKGDKKQIQIQGSVISFGLHSVSIFLPLFDTAKEIMWKSQLKVDKVIKDRKKPNQLRIYLHYDKKSPKKDIFWDIKKFQKVNALIGYTTDAPLRMKVSLGVQTNKGLQIIHASDHL